MKRNTIIILTICILGIGLEQSSATLPVLLTINDSNPSAVTITATGLAPIANDTGRTANDGVDLLTFFSQNQSSLFGGPLPNSTLQGGNLTLSYDNVYGDDYSTGGGANYFDLELFVGNSTPGSTDPENFSTTQPAFSGSWTINLSSLGVSASALPAAGTHGQILSGYYGNPGTVLGQWQVDTVPEPSTGSLFVLGLAIGFVYWRRRACKNAATIA